MANNQSTGPSLETLGHDVLREICKVINDVQPHEFVKAGGKNQKSLDALSKTSKMLREISAPALFKDVTIRGDWRQSLKILEKLKDCPAVAHYTRTFKFDIYVTDHKKYPPPMNLAPSLVDVLKQMKNMTKCVLVVPEWHAEIFEQAFKDGGIVLPGVETLVVGPYCDFMVGMCPNVTTVSSNGWQWLHSERQRGAEVDREHTVNLINAVANAGNVTRLEIMEWWSMKLVNVLSDKLTKLQYLAMDGGSYQESIAKFLPILGKMTNLHTLALASASDLRVGFDPPGCGNVYMGPGGKEHLAQVIQEGKEAEKKVAGMVCDAIGPHLKQLWVGDGTRFEILRNRDWELERFVRHDEARVKIVGYPSP